MTLQTLTGLPYSTLLNHLLPHPNGAIETIDGDEKLIKRAFKACSALKTPPYYRQTALFTLTKKCLTDKQRYMIEQNKNPEIREYVKLCRVCLEEEDSILHRMYDCPPVQYMTDVITHAIQAHDGIKITKNTMKHSPSDHHRLFLFLDTPLSLRKNSNKETIRTQKTIALSLIHI